MKNDAFILKRIFVIFLALLVLIPPAALGQIDLNKLKNTAKEKVQKKEEPKSNPTNNQKTKTQTNEVKSNEIKLTALKYNELEPIVIGFTQLLDNMKLNPTSGEFSIDAFSVKNLPAEDANGQRVSYSLNETDHIFSVALALKGKEIGRLAYEYYISGKQIWYEMKSTYNEKYPKILTISEGGDYSLLFYLDDKKIHAIDLEVIQISNKNNVSGLFVNKPTELLGRLAFKNFSYDEADPNSELVFRFFYASLNPEYVYNDPIKINARILKHLPADEYEILGVYADEISLGNNWQLSDNIFFSIPGERYKYVYGRDIIALSAKYSVDLTLGTDLYRYDFEVKDGKIISSDFPEVNDGGAFWLKRKKLSTPKYENFRPTANVATIKDNVSMMVRSVDGKTNKGCGAGTPVVFTDGEGLFSNPSVSEAVKMKFEYKNTEHITTIKKGNDIVAQHIIYKLFDGSFSYLAYMTDVEAKADYITPIFMDALANLPAGNHDLTVVFELASGKISDVVGVQKVSFNSVAGNPKYKAQSELIKTRMAMSESELADVRYLKYGGEDWALYENNCGRIVWLRQDEDKEFYLYPEDKGMFDRNGGPLEQWNFGTRKWLPIDDFKPYASTFKITENALAMYNLKQVPKDISEKLRAIVGTEFSSATDFMAKIESLIGKDAAQKYEAILQSNARVDKVKICN
jgi:hypothetical protein